MLEGEAKKKLKNAELEAKKTRLRIWTNYVAPATNSKAIHDQNFTGKVAMSRSFFKVLLNLCFSLFNVLCLAFCRWLRLSVEIVLL